MAPAGYGKSTLLAEWAARDERPFVWVTLTPRERDVATVATAMSEAFVETGWVDTGAPARAHRIGGGEMAALEGLMRFLDRGGRRFVLVLDDAHTTQARAVKPVVSALLDRIGTDRRSRWPHAWSRHCRSDGCAPTAGWSRCAPKIWRWCRPKLPRC